MYLQSCERRRSLCTNHCHATFEHDASVFTEFNIGLIAKRDRGRKSRNTSRHVAFGSVASEQLRFRGSQSKQPRKRFFNDELHGAYGTSQWLESELHSVDRRGLIEWKHDDRGWQQLDDGFRRWSLLANLYRYNNICEHVDCELSYDREC